MIDRMGIYVCDDANAWIFNDTVIAALGESPRKQMPMQFTGGKHVFGYGRNHPVFWISEGKSDKGKHYAFSALNRAQVHAFHEAALKAGGKDNGAPIPRPHYREHYCGAVVIDLYGNNVEAVCHKPEAA